MTLDSSTIPAAKEEDGVLLDGVELLNVGLPVKEVLRAVHLSSTY